MDGVGRARAGADGGDDVADMASPKTDHSSGASAGNAIRRMPDVTRCKVEARDALRGKSAEVEEAVLLGCRNGKEGRVVWREKSIGSRREARGEWLDSLLVGVSLRGSLAIGCSKSTAKCFNECDDRTTE